MKKGRRAWLTAALFVVLGSFSGPSQAAVFDFSGILTQADSMLFSQDGIALTVTGSAGPIAAVVHRDEDGLGVTYEGDRASNTTASQVDGRDELESLILTFGAPVRLSSATFSLVGSNDQFSLSADGTLLFSGNIPSSRTKTFAGGNTGRVFIFGTGEEDDDYKVKGIEVFPQAGADPVVPEPVTGASFAIGMMGIWRRTARCSGIFARNRASCRKGSRGRGKG
ncbi:MAG: hypothetical protein ACM3L6_00475 [Deltaproteobacteria bacterium]